MSQYQKYKINLDFTEARDSERQWHQLGHMQVRISLQTDNHARTPPLCFYRPDALPATQPTASKHFALFNTTRMQKALQPHNCTANKTVQIPNMTWYWNYCYTNCKYKSILSVYSLVRDDWGLKGVEPHATVDNPPCPCNFWPP